MKKSLIPVLFLLGVGVLAARPARGGFGQGRACANLPQSSAPLSLSAAATEALRFQIDEERMAGEIYRKLGEQWAVRPFKNIPRAEARHQAWLTAVAKRAGTALPDATVAGSFATPTIQSRHDALLARGQVSLIEALKVGACIEEQDIADLRSLTATTDSADLRAVAAALEAGSHNHLRAFVRHLRSRGINYEPQVLSREEFAAIISSGSTTGVTQSGVCRGPCWRKWTGTSLCPARCAEGPARPPFRRLTLVNQEAESMTASTRWRGRRGCPGDRNATPPM